MAPINTQNIVEVSGGQNANVVHGDMIATQNNIFPQTSPSNVFLTWNDNQPKILSLFKSLIIWIPFWYCINFILPTISSLFDRLFVGVVFFVFTIIVLIWKNSSTLKIVRYGDQEIIITSKELIQPYLYILEEVPRRKNWVRLRHKGKPVEIAFMFKNNYFPFLGSKHSFMEWWAHQGGSIA